MWPLQRKGIGGKVLYLPIDSLRPNPDQPRRVFDQEALEELASSIRSLGLLQPLTVRRQDGGWELVAGERRLRAARMAGLKEVPCLLVGVDEQESSLLSLMENIQRRDLDFWEEAQALQTLLQVTGLSQEGVAKQLGLSQSAVANKLRLLKLSPEALQLLRRAGLTERHARALLRLPAEMQTSCAHYVVAHNLTVAKTEEYVEALLQPPVERKGKPILILKDVRFFLNTVKKGLSLMADAGVRADCRREDTEEEILLTIRIPRQTA